FSTGVVVVRMRKDRTIYLAMLTVWWFCPPMTIEENHSMESLVAVDQNKDEIAAVKLVSLRREDNGGGKQEHKHLHQTFSSFGKLNK
ncbi:hypothetical protein HAX54_029865, partial [Datura stramonium]|nr:hypothetical protein [Datura stramonium]